MLLAVLTYPFAPGTRRERIIFWMDIIIVATTLGMFLWVFILNTLQTLILVYPAGTYGVVFSVANLLLVVGFVGLIQRDVTSSARVSLIFLGLGALCATLADGWLVYCQTSGQPCNLTIVNILRLGAAEGILLAAAMVIVLRSGTKAMTQEIYKPFSPVLRLVIPYLAVAAGWALLINMVYLVGFGDQSLMGALLGSIMLVGLVLVRQFIVLQENARLYREMQRLAVTDSLTGLYNRHYFNETLGREIERSRRYNTALALLLMDVDRFKMFNDRYGHLQGDEVLKMVARVLAAQLRSTDILARFGGDEFAIILPETDRGGAISVSKKIEHAMAQHKYKDWLLGVSVGLGVYHPGMTLESFIEQADRKLYRNKATKASAHIIREAEQAAGIPQPELGESSSH
jgi:diguanylate cyclase (GGDEF)-like protein